MIKNAIGIWKSNFSFLRNIRVVATKSNMRFLIKLVKVSTILHNLLVGHHTVPKLWLISSSSSGTGSSNGKCHEEVHDFLSAKLQ
jgi:hypothetical protein